MESCYHIGYKIAGKLRTCTGTANMAGTTNMCRNNKIVFGSAIAQGNKKRGMGEWLIIQKEAANSIIQG